MSILVMILLGLIAGWLASMIIGTNKGTLMDIIFGIVGAIIGGLIMNFLGQPGVTGFNLYSIAVSVIGAVVLIWIGRLLRRA